ncbi:hypothetical protein MMC10_006657 [Thelotrema lepadinum]|nr:hypothetical protein [Thelotrema lepadinum]
MPQIYCAICGGPVIGDCYGCEDYTKWLQDAVLLTTAHRTEQGTEELDAYWAPDVLSGQYPFDLGPNPPEESQRSVLRLDAVSSDGSTSFVTTESGKQVEAMRVDLSPLSPILDHGGLLYLPVHRSCLQLADQFIASTKSSPFMTGTPQDGITSIMNLWETLYRRLRGDVLCSRTFILPELHDYFGGRLCRNVDWERSSDPEHGLLHEQNPLHVPNLTRSVLQNLKPAPSADKNAARQDWFRYSMLNEQLIPWLWDLDADLVLEKQGSGSWDWVDLHARLTDFKIHEPSDKSIDIPLALRNRRRIWRLLEEARIHDYARKQEELVAYGERVKQAEQVRKEAVFVGTWANPPGASAFVQPLWHNSVKS